MLPPTFYSGNPTFTKLRIGSRNAATPCAKPLGSIITSVADPYIDEFKLLVNGNSVGVMAVGEFTTSFSTMVAANPGDVMRVYNYVSSISIDSAYLTVLRLQ